MARIRAPTAWRAAGRGDTQDAHRDAQSDQLRDHTDAHRQDLGQFNTSGDYRDLLRASERPAESYTEPWWLFLDMWDAAGDLHIRVAEFALQIRSVGHWYTFQFIPRSSSVCQARFAILRINTFLGVQIVGNLLRIPYLKMDIFNNATSSTPLIPLLMSPS